jgi:hypothetical protein
VVEISKQSSFFEFIGINIDCNVRSFLPLYLLSHSRPFLCSGCPIPLFVLVSHHHLFNPLDDVKHVICIVNFFFAVYSFVWCHRLVQTDQEPKTFIDEVLLSPGICGSVK